MTMKKYHPQTLAVRAGTTRYAGEHSDALFLTSSFVFDKAEQAKAVFSEEVIGYSYSRFSNPTVTAFEERMTALECGARSVATATGMGAITASVLSFVQAGDHIVCARNVFGSTFALFNHYIRRMGVEVSFVDLNDYAAWQAAVKPNTKLFFLESLTNPLLEVADIARISSIAKQQNLLFIVDNCFASPIVQNPLLLGADIVVHSATKHIDGHGRCLGGIVICKTVENATTVHQFVRTAGLSLNAFEAWNFIKGLETLPIRMAQSMLNTQQVVDFLSNHDKVSKLYYPGLASHSTHSIAKQQMNGFGSIIAFEIKGEQAEAWRVIDNAELFSITANLGDTRSTITHPATTTHVRLTEEDRQAVNIKQSLIRIAIGLEHPDDICADLKQGLDSI